MGEYHDLYLKSDILLLADVFQNFRNTCLTYYGVDPPHYVSSPGLAWDAMLKMTKINLDLITDIDMQLFIKKGMRGGISYIAHRCAEANNQYMKNYDPHKSQVISCIWMPILFMVGLCHSHYLIEILNGSIAQAQDPMKTQLANGSNTLIQNNMELVRSTKLI